MHGEKVKVALFVVLLLTVGACQTSIVRNGVEVPEEEFLRLKVESDPINKGSRRR